MAVIEKPVGNFTETDIDDEIVIMRLDNGELLSLSGTGAAIWRLIDGTRDRDALLTALAAEYAASEQQLVEEIDDFLAQLTEAGLIAEE
jgi:hypothetical protein